MYIEQMKTWIKRGALWAWDHKYQIMILLVARQIVIWAVPIIVVKSGGLDAIAFWVDFFERVTK